MLSLDWLRPRLEPIANAPVWCVACSGGRDSMVLLHLLQSMDSRPPLRVLHVNHGLSAFADQWQAFVESRAIEYGLVCSSFKADLTVGASEADARNARYQIFSDQLEEDECALLAHHQDDQHETLLLRLLRGAGLSGLRAMPVARPVGAGQVFRPLLACASEELGHYAQRHGVRWCEDDSNAGTAFDRNYLRHEIFPRLDQRWASRPAAWQHSLDALNEAHALLDEFSALDANERCQHVPLGGLRVDVSNASLARIKNLVRFCCVSESWPLPPQAVWAELQASVLDASIDSQPALRWKGVILRRYRGALYIQKDQAREPLTPHGLADLAPKEHVLADLGNGLVCKVENLDAADTLRNIKLNYRAGGERLLLANGRRRDLKELFQELRVPPWLRDQLPLIYIDGELRLIAGVEVASAISSCAATVGEKTAVTT